MVFKNLNMKIAGKSVIVIAVLFISTLPLAAHAQQKTRTINKSKQKKEDARERKLRELAEAYKRADAEYEAAMAAAAEADRTARAAAQEEFNKQMQAVKGDGDIVIAYRKGESQDEEEFRGAYERYDTQEKMATTELDEKLRDTANKYAAACEAARKRKDYEYKKLNAAREVEMGGLRNVPLRDQFDPANGNLGEAACGPTSLGMALEYFGVKIPTSQIIQEMGFDPNKGATILELIDYANRHLPGSHFSWGTAVPFADEMNYLQNNVSGGGLVIVPIEGEYDGGKVAQEGHYVVVTDAREGYIFANDPAGGEKVVFDKQEFEGLWKPSKDGKKSCVVVKR